MISLIKYEVRKILEWKGIYIAFIISLVLYGLYIYSIIPSSLASYRAAYKYYKIGEGQISSEKIAFAKEGIKDINKLHDEGIKFDEKNLAKSILYKDILEVADKRNIYKEAVNYYENKEIKNSSEKLSYELLKKIGPPDSVNYTEGWTRIIEFSWGMGRYFILAIVLLGVSIIIPQEHLTGMNSLISSTRENKHKLIYAKIGAAVVFTALVALIFSVINIITNWYIYGLKGWNAPLKSIYFTTPYGIRVWQFFILQQLFYIMSVTIFALLTLLISVFSKNSVISLSVGGGVFAAYDFITKHTPVDPAPGTMGFLIKDFTRLRDICTSYLNVHSIFGYPVLYEKVLFIVIFLLLILTGSGVLFLYRKCSKVRG